MSPEPQKDNLLATYYRGITARVRGEVDFINALFKEHPGVKGEGNESVLRDLLRRFLPGRYGVGTGVVIDRLGQHSRQCDIVLYERHLYPSLLSLTSVHLFPVDLVYAVIEIKTTLNAEQARTARENVRSVRRLSVVDTPFAHTTSAGGNLTMVQRQGTPPMGFVFAYNSDAVACETIKGWFEPGDQDSSLEPLMLGCLDFGLIRYMDVGQPAAGKPKFALVPAMKDDSPWLVENDGEVTLEGVLCPTKTLGGRRYAVDESRVLLLFVLLLSEMMQTKFINTELRFSQHYLTATMKGRIES